MNKDCAILELSELIIDITDPRLTRWEREKRVIAARIKAKGYIIKAQKEAGK